MHSIIVSRLWFRIRRSQPGGKLFVRCLPVFKMDRHLCNISCRRFFFAAFTEVKIEKGQKGADVLFFYGVIISAFK